MFDGLARDVQFGGRMLAKSPGFTAVAALSLALGIGANTTIFTLINAVRLKMLPVADPAQLVILRWSAPDRIRTPARSTWGSSRSEGGRQLGTSFSYPAFQAIRDRNQVFSSVFGFVNMGRVSVAAGAQPGLAQLQLVTGGAFDTLGLSLAMGRGIGMEDDKPSAEAVAVISHGYWQGRFGGDPAILGKSMFVNGKPGSSVSPVRAASSSKAWISREIQELV